MIFSKSKYNFLTLITLVIFSIVACDDGDILLDEEIDFDTNDLEFCNLRNAEGNIQTTVFFNINTSTNEVLSFQLNNSNFIPTQESVAASELRAVENLNLSLRDFDTTINENYFCSGIPNSSVQILNELRGVSGNIEIQTRNITTLDGDDDNDGLTNEEEGFDPSLILDVVTFADGQITIRTDLSVFQDSDEDGIPNFRDQDDDNDNVITAQEITRDTENNTIIQTDTDGDGTPDYLDIDDDGDSVLTINEISEEGPLPNSPENQNPDGLPNYLNNQIQEELIATERIENRFSSRFRTSVVGLFVGLSDGTSTIIRDILRFGEFDVIDTVEAEAQVIEPTAESENDTNNTNPEEVTEP